MKELEKNLTKIYKGTGIAFIGNIVGLFLSFLSITIMARILTRDDYGTFYLGFTIFQITFTVASLGLMDGIARYIGYFVGKKDEKKVKAVIYAGIKLSILSSIIFSSLLFLSSEKLSEVFDNPELLPVLEIFSISLPFFIFSNIVASIYRGFEDIRFKVKYIDVFQNSARLLFILIAFFILPTLYSLTLAFALPFFVLGVISIFKLRGIFFRASGMEKELIFFSLPLLFSSIMGLIMSWSDTVMLGYFRSSEEVGLYNTANPLARFLSVVLFSLVLIYVPIASKLIASGKISELKDIYKIMTKWITVVALPLFCLFLFYPSEVISLLFGDKYVEANLALQILSLGFITHVFFGPNGVTLVALGKTRVLMINSLILGILNIALNIILIPRYGIEGAALATSLSFICFNVLVSSELYKFKRIFPFSFNQVMIFILALTLAFILSYLRINFITFAFLVLLAVLLLTRIFKEKGDEIIFNMLKSSLKL